jgi:hypothetical protein
MPMPLFAPFEATLTVVTRGLTNGGKLPSHGERFAASDPRP